MTDKLRELTLLALDSHGCERLKDFYECGPVQRAAVETFLEAALSQQDAQEVPHLKKLLHAMHQESNAKHNLNEWLRASPAFAQRAAQAEAEWVVAVKHLVAAQMEAQKYVEESAAPTPPAVKESLTDQTDDDSELAQQDAQAVAQEPVAGMDEFLADLNRSRAKYPNNARMWDGLVGEVDELRRAYAGDGDRRAEAFDVAVCAFRIATEGDAGGNALLKAPQPTAVPHGYMLVPVEPTKEMERAAFNELELPGTATENGTSMRNRVYRAMLNAAPTPPAQQDAQAVAQDHRDLYARGWINGTQVQSLIDWCNSGCAKRADIAFTGGPSRQIAYAIEHLVKRASNLETSEGVFVPRKLLATVANALGLPYETEHTSLRSKLLDILSFAAPAQRVELTDDEIDAIGNSEWGGYPSYDREFKRILRAVLEAYERKNGIK